MALLVVALVAACSSPTQMPSPSGGPASTATPVASPADLGISAGAVPAGRYRLQGFDPGITVELDGSWQSLAQQSGYASITQVTRPASSKPYAAGTLIQITRAVTVVSGPDEEIKPTTASEAVDALRGGLGAMVIESSDSRMGGLEGRQVTVERPGEGPPMSRDVVGVLEIPAGSIVLFPGTRLWIAYFDQADGVVAIVVHSSIKNWDAELAAAEPLLEQVRFELP